METYLRDPMVCSLRKGHLQRRSFIAQHAWRSTDEGYSSGEHVLAVRVAASWFKVLFTQSVQLSVDTPAPHQKRRPKLLHLHLPNPSSFWALLLPSARRLPWVVHWQSDALTPHSGGLIRWCYRLYKPLNQRYCDTQRKSSSRPTDTSTRVPRWRRLPISAS